MTTDTYSCGEPSAVTVVIATLGGGTLKTTIEALNRGSVVPSEILVCIPVNEASRAQALSFPNVKVIITDCRGQVAQRAVGFRNAAHDFVMQLDDDILVDERCIEQLLKTVNKFGNKVAVAPALINLATGESVYRKPEVNGALHKLYYWLVNGSGGYQPGRINQVGAAIGIDLTGSDGGVLDAEWLAGGCVMHRRENLVLENYYPFTGKAYFEDVIHSYHLMQKGVSLKVDAAAVCRLEMLDTLSYGPQEYFNYLAADFKARKYAMQLYSKKSLRIYIFYLISYLGYVYKKATGSS